jgi:uncharacterized protein (TIGR03083 family)
MTTDPTWDFREPASKDRLLGVVRRESEETFALANNPARWEAPTACEGWQVRDIVGHLVDTTESYLSGFTMARTGGTAPEPHGLRVMARLVDESARAYRKVPQAEMLDRLHDDATRMLAIFDELDDAEWSSLRVPHNYMGNLPACFYAAFQLIDYTIHSWDIRQGRGQAHAVDGDAADLLVPLIYILLQSTADSTGVNEPFSVGIRVSGVNGGECRADVSGQGVQFTPTSLEACPATLEFDPATFALVACGRINGGTVRGDRAVATRFRNVFFAI